MQPRTKRQKEVLDFITRYVSRNGYKPSYQQIARQLGVSSKAGIARHIEALETQGLISRRRENGSFSLELLSQNVSSDAVCRIEFLDGNLVDQPTRDTRHSEIVIAKFMIGSLDPEDVFAVMARNDSLTDKHICDGDIVLFERRSYARRGDIVAAIVDDELLLGQFFQVGAETEIRPANPDFKTMIFPADGVVVHGIMRGLLRPIASKDH